jgi:hypothetical protein
MLAFGSILCLSDARNNPLDFVIQAEIIRSSVAATFIFYFFLTNFVGVYNEISMNHQIHI